MKILVFGAGVIGTTYAWQISNTGHNVNILVHKGKQPTKNRSFYINCLDLRNNKQRHTKIVYHSTVIDDFSPKDCYDLIIVSVNSNQLHSILPVLAQKAGNTDILFLHISVPASSHWL